MPAGEESTIPESNTVEAEAEAAKQVAIEAENEAAALAAETEDQPDPVKPESLPAEAIDTELVQAAVAKAAAPKPAAPSQSRLAQLQARVAKDPLDGEAQLALLADVEAKGDLERTRQVYEDFLKVFPDQVSVTLLNHS